ncbi:hypothetical protein LAZ67_5004501, partial [Cordylochernes scorpioides]
MTQIRKEKFSDISWRLSEKSSQVFEGVITCDKRCCKSLEKLKRTIEQKRPNLKKNTLINFHQDNERSHTAYLTLTKITRYGWTLMTQPAYSPDLVTLYMLEPSPETCRRDQGTDLVGWFSPRMEEACSSSSRQRRDSQQTRGSSRFPTPPFMSSLGMVAPERISEDEEESYTSGTTLPKPLTILNGRIPSTLVMATVEPFHEGRRQADGAQFEGFGLSVRVVKGGLQQSPTKLGFDEDSMYGSREEILEALDKLVGHAIQTSHFPLWQAFI